MKIIIFLLLSLMVSCALNQSRRPVLKSKVVLKGGEYQDESWKDELAFKRISWFQDATLTQEIIIGELKKDSPFGVWFGNQKLALDRCHQFFVSFLYADINANPKVNHLSSELKGNALSEQAVLEFSGQIKAHPMYGDYKLQNHKVVGWCNKSNRDINDISITLPGYKTQKLKL